MRRELPEHMHRRRLIVDEGTSLARGRDFATQDDRSAVGLNAIGFKHFRGSAFGGGFEIEDGGEDGLLRAGADDLGSVSPSAGTVADDVGRARPTVSGIVGTNRR